MIPTMTEVTKAVEALVSREDTLKLIRRAGVVALHSKQTVPPVAVLFVFKERLEKKRRVDDLLNTPFNKMVKLARVAFNKHQAEEQAAQDAVMEEKRKALLLKLLTDQQKAEMPTE